MRVLSLLLLSGLIFAQPKTEPTQCFPFESLSVEDRRIAESLLTRLLDSEGLYTLTTPVKPISFGFAYLFVPVSQANTHAELAAWKRVAAAFRCGDDLEAAVIPVGPMYRQKQFWNFVIARRSAVQRVESENLEYFAQFGPDRSRNALTLIELVDQSRDEIAREGYGYLLGHPRYSVQFNNTLQRLRQQHRAIQSSSYSIKTFDEKGLQFNWPVPLNHLENSEDREIRERTDKALDEYKKRRQNFIGSDKPGAAALLRDWFCGEKGCQLPR